MGAYKWTNTVFTEVKRGKSGGRNESQNDTQDEYAELKKMIHKENGNLISIKDHSSYTCIFLNCTGFVHMSFKNMLRIINV